MDNYRALLAIVISFVILIGYQYFFVGFSHEDAKVQGEKAPQTTVSVTPDQPKSTAPAAQLSTGNSLPAQPVATTASVPQIAAKKVVVDTELYTATFSENGASLESFVLKHYKESNTKDSPGKQLLPGATDDGSLAFSWGDILSKTLHYVVAKDSVPFVDGKGQLVFTADAGNGVHVQKVFSFSQTDYRIDMQVTITNASGQTLQGAPQIYQVDRPIQHTTTRNRYSFEGAAAYNGDSLEKS